MAVKHVHISPRTGKDKPLEIYEFEDAETSASTGHFLLGENEMKKVAEKMAKTLTKKKGAQQ